QSVLYADELEAACRGVNLHDFAFVFCHTVGDFELIGWNRFLARTRLPGHLLILLRQTPGYRACNWLKRRAHPYWRLRPRYLSAIRSRLGSRFTLLTDSEALTE